MENTKVWDINSQEYKDEIARIEALANKPSEYHKWDDAGAKWVKSASHARPLVVEHIRAERNAAWPAFDLLVSKERLYNDGARIDELKNLGFQLQEAPQKAEEILSNLTKFDDITSLKLSEIIEVPDGIELF